jgi:hypothetical protein
MSLDTVLKIGKSFRESPEGWPYHRFVKSIEDVINSYKRNKDSEGKSIETIIYRLPVTGNLKNGFEFDFNKMDLLTDESKISSLLYLNFKTADKDKEKKYLFGDIVYSRFKNAKGELKEDGNYRLSTEKKEGSFDRCRELAAGLEHTIIGAFRSCFDKNLSRIEDDILGMHPGVVIHFSFEGNKTWLEQDTVEEILKATLLDAFVVEVPGVDRNVYALNKTLFKTIKPPIWDKKSKTFKDPDGIGGVTPGFSNSNTHKLKAFDSPDDIWDLMFAIDFAEHPLFRVKDIGIVVLPKGTNLTVPQLVNFFKKSTSVHEEGENEDILNVNNIFKKNHAEESDWDSLFEPLIENTFDGNVEFDVIFLKPKTGSSPAVDLIELSSIKKSHLKDVHERIRDVKIELQDELKRIFIKSNKPFIFDLKDNFLNILTNKTKSEKKYQFHLLKVLPQIYQDTYYEDPLLLPAFVERTEYNIRNDSSFNYHYFRFNFLFLSKIQKNNLLMEITNSSSYAIGKCLGTMARPFAASWKDKCPIKSFEKSYVGNLTRRIANKEDAVKFYNFLHEKLAIHEKNYPEQLNASRQFVQILQELSGVKYNKNESAFGFFESYFEWQTRSVKSELESEIEN